MLKIRSLARLISTRAFPSAAGAVAIGVLSLAATPLAAAPFAPAGMAATVAAEKAAVDDQLIAEVGYRDGRYRGHRGYHRSHHRDRYAHRHHHGRPIYRHHRHDPGAAVAAGIVGLTAGAIISGALAPQPIYNIPPQPVYRVPAQPVYRVGPQPVYRVAPRPVHRVAPHRVAPRGDRLIGRVSAGDLAYCTQRYRSFDPVSFTFLGYDGRRHLCRIP